MTKTAQIKAIQALTTEYSRNELRAMDDKDREALYNMLTAEEEGKAEAASAGDFGDLYDEARKAGKSRCGALRYAAEAWTATRKDFIQCAEQYGINRYTAATQWQQGRS